MPVIEDILITRKSKNSIVVYDDPVSKLSVMGKIHSVPLVTEDHVFIELLESSEKDQDKWSDPKLLPTARLRWPRFPNYTAEDLLDER